MKFKKNKFSHWLYFSLFTFNTLISIPLRIIFKPKKNIILLYGHQFNGNLKSIYNYAHQEKNIEAEFFFLTASPSLHKSLKRKGINSALAINPNIISKFINTKLIITDHGPHSLLFFLKYSNIRFADTWHGIPFKGYEPKEFKLLHRYTEIWLTSTSIKDIYIKKFGFSPRKLVITGYPRTDDLINSKSPPSKVREKYNINQGYKKIYLFAPTWGHDNKNNTSAFPFHIKESTFLSDINKIMVQTESLFIIRSHLNQTFINTEKYSNLVFMSAENYSNTEDILLLSDILICDWSSIAFDFLLLDRPTIFLNTPPPFKSGFTLNKDYRYGNIAKNYNEMLKLIKKLSILNTKTENPQLRESVKKHIYNSNADGHASKRIYRRILTLIKD